MAKKSGNLVDLAQAHCHENGHRFTEPRRQVLNILNASRRHIGAYDIIAAMPEGTKPPTVYRALEFWETEGFVHCISSLSAYMICHAGHRHQGSQYMVCDDCGKIEEIHLCRLPPSLQDRMNETGFHLSRWNAELHGLCHKCHA